jgi:hypothetical protein
VTTLVAQRSAYFGSFDAERQWRPSDLAVFPRLADPAADRLVACMDEALFAATAPGDLLVTRGPVGERLLEVWRTAGFSLEHHQCTEGTVDGATVEQALLDDATLRCILANGATRPAPYAVLPETAQLLALLGRADAVPAPQTAVRVNSKTWSSRLAARNGLPGAGQVVGTAGELATVADNLAGKGAAVLVKDVHGVAGRGIFEITSPRMLARLVRHLSGQEERGLRVECVVQVRYDRAADFSGQVQVDRDGSWRLLGLQSLANAAFRHEMSGPIPAGVAGAAWRLGYEQVLDTVARELAAEGYFGPVAVDSMLLRDGGWVPVLEVNARMSMGALNMALDARVREFGLRSHLWQEDVALEPGADADCLLRVMAEDGLLYAGGRLPGVLPLVGGSLTAPRGRLVCAALCPPESFVRWRLRTRNAARRAGIRSTAREAW